MSGNGHETNGSKYAVWPLDKKDFVLYGRSLDEKEESVLLLTADELPAELEVDAQFARFIHNLFCTNPDEPELVYTLDNRPYFVLPWDDKVDKLFVDFMDRLVNTRLRNISRVSFALQMELPLNG